MESEMKCKNLCGKDLTGKQLLYCSDRCRMQHRRQAESERDAPQPERKPNSSNPNKAEQKPDTGLVALLGKPVADIELDIVAKESARHTQGLTLAKVLEAKAKLEKIPQPDFIEISTNPAYTGIRRPSNFGQSDCECKHCQANRYCGSKLVINHNGRKSAVKLGKNEFNRVSLPGDVDYKVAI